MRTKIGIFHHTYTPAGTIKAENNVEVAFLQSQANNQDQIFNC